MNLARSIPCLVVALVAASDAFAAGPTPEQLEFFEKRIRPLLSESCYKCHSARSEKLKGGLMLDSREALLKGGDTGPALVPGNLEKSLLIEAVHWAKDDLQMPPKKRLAPQQVADLEAWVKDGAPWPAEVAPKRAAAPVFDLKKRKLDHWCWKPPLDAQPPSVKAADWPRDAVDAALIALHRQQHITATLNGQAIPLGQLDQNKIAKADFDDMSARLRARADERLHLPAFARE